MTHAETEEDDEKQAWLLEHTPLIFAAMIPERTRWPYLGALEAMQAAEALYFTIKHPSHAAQKRYQESQNLKLETRR